MGNACVYFFPYPGLGDFVMASPLFNALLKRETENKHILIVRDDCRFMDDIKDLIPFDDVLVFYRKDHWKKIKLFFKLKKMNVSRIINFHHSPRYIPFFRLICKDVYSTHLLKTIHPYEISRHLMKKMKISEETPIISVNIPKNSREYAERWLSDRNIKEGKYILFIPGSFEKKRRYSLDGWKKITDFIRSEYPELSIVANLGPWEKELEKALVDSGIFVFSEPGLSILTGLIDKSRFVISNDTGAFHLAYSIKKGCIGFMKRNGRMTAHPYSEYAKAIYPPGECDSDCDNCSIKCVEDIEIDKILEEIKRHGL